jgi:hypothetical protein
MSYKGKPRVGIDQRGFLTENDLDANVVGK